MNEDDPQFSSEEMRTLLAALRLLLEERNRPRDVNYRTPEQVDLAADAALERLRRENRKWWKKFWKTVAKVALVVAILGGLASIGRCAEVFRISSNTCG